MPPGTPLLPGPTADQLVELNRLHQQGLYLDAFRLCEQLPPLTQWQGAPALVLAGRLAQRWGDAPLSNRLHVQAYRTDPTDWLARYYHLYTRWSRHGTFEALRLTAEGVQSLPLVPTNREQAYFWLLHARLLCSFRDFTAAEAISRRVLAHFAHDPWVWVDQADLLENQDRYPEAMEAAEEALRRQPWYVPAVMSKAHLLQLQQRDDEAATLLRSALQHVQSGILVKMLVGLCEEAGRLDVIPALLDLAGSDLPTPDHAD
jgi:tetratricopeptide (TPR) repeat protein